MMFKKFFSRSESNNTGDYSQIPEFQDAINSEKHKNFCVLPFIHLATTTEGTCRLCCKVSKHDVILDDNGEPFNLNTHSIDEIWNSNHMRDRRLRILQDEKLPECKTCFKEEDIFYSNWSNKNKKELPSKRRKENQKWLHKEDTKLADPWRDVVNQPRIRYLDIRLSNLCNLKCRMCWPHFSSQIVKEQQHFKKTGQKTWYHNYDVDEWDTEKLWNGINNNLVDIEEITFVGGEPTLHDEIYELLEKLVDTGLSKNIRLKFTVNLTNIQERFLDLFPKFKKTIINGSIDGVGAVNDYIRYPSNWPIIERNIDKIIEIRRENFLSLTLTPVIQIYNIFGIRDMVTWYTNKWLNVNYQKTQLYFTLDLDLLYDPSYLNIKLLNSSAKHQWYDEVYLPTIEHLDELIENIDKTSEFHQNQWFILNNLKNRVVNIASYMEVHGYDKKTDKWVYWFNDTSDPELAEKCLRYTQQLDAHRKQSVYDIIPNFDEIIKHEQNQ